MVGLGLGAISAPEGSFVLSELHGRDRERNANSSFPWYAVRGASGRRRVRGKDRVPLNSVVHFVASMNSFLPDRADTGRNG